MSLRLAPAGAAGGGPGGGRVLKGRTCWSEGASEEQREQESLSKGGGYG